MVHEIPTTPPDKPLVGKTLLFPIAALLAAGCSGQMVQGRVLNIQGETLPGVAVKVADRDYETLTNMLGEYTVPYRGDTFHVSFAKSGFAPARLTLPTVNPRPAEIPDVEMWQLPGGAGVYLFEKFRYFSTSWEEPVPFFPENGGTAFGIRRDPERKTSQARPVIVCYRTPRYDARLARLEKIMAKRVDGQRESTAMWVAAGPVNIEVRALDEEEEMLLELRPLRPLAPGTYAVHWGAFEGYTTLENRAFTFTVTAPVES